MSRRAADRVAVQDGERGRRLADRCYGVGERCDERFPRIFQPDPAVQEDVQCGVAAFVISLRYLYGCVIYMNNVEVFRNGVSGDLSSSSVGLNAYTDLLYRQISLPVKTMGVESVTYLQEGTNTIAIAIVAQTASQTTSCSTARCGWRWGARACSTTPSPTR